MALDPPASEALNAYMIVYADTDVSPEFFSGDGAADAAWRRFEQAKASWTCRLFACVAATGYGEVKP